MTPIDGVYQSTDWVGVNSASIRPRGRHGVAEEELDQETIVTDPATGHIHKLNTVATEVWRMCDGRTSMREMSEWLTGVYAVDLENAMDYVDQLVARFAEASLLELDG
jgi:hypothetical protein